MGGNQKGGVNHSEAEGEDCFVPTLTAEVCVKVVAGLAMTEYIINLAT